MCPTDPDTRRRAAPADRPQPGRPGRARHEVRLAETLLTPAEQARAALEKWNGYAPAAAEEQDLDSELDRRPARAAAR
ncbi:hypothetical protein [Streptomyces sp. NPDC047841]|uniref:hypothetical protein n=1 Tax=Streptomyces sp. NPDC047841 TaxID=3154708 RepID=UPI0034556273